jgi:hypothetical protein
MSWSNTIRGNQDEVLKEVLNLHWNGVPGSVVDAINAMIYNQPELPEGYQIVVETSGHAYVPPEETKKKYPQYVNQFQANVKVYFEKVEVKPIAEVAKEITSEAK